MEILTICNILLKRVFTIKYVCFPKQTCFKMNIHTLGSKLQKFVMVLCLQPTFPRCLLSTGGIWWNSPGQEKSKSQLINQIIYTCKIVPRSNRIINFNSKYGGSLFFLGQWKDIISTYLSQSLGKWCDIFQSGLSFNYKNGWCSTWDDWKSL